MAPAKPRTYSDAVQSWERWYDGIHKRDPVALGALDRLLDGMMSTSLNEEPTARELEVLAELSFGATHESAARHMLLGRETIKSHLRHVRGKLRASTSTHAVAIVLRRGLIE